MNNNELKEIVQNTFEFNFGCKPSKKQITLLEADSNGYRIQCYIGNKEMIIWNKDQSIDIIN